VATLLLLELASPRPCCSSSSPGRQVRPPSPPAPFLPGGGGGPARRRRGGSKSSSAGATEESGAANRAWRAANQDRGTVNRAWGLPACELGDRVYQARSGSRRNQELQDDPRGDVDESRGSTAVPARGSGMEERGHRCRPGPRRWRGGAGAALMAPIAAMARSRGGGGVADVQRRRCEPGLWRSVEQQGRCRRAGATRRA